MSTINFLGSYSGIDQSVIDQLMAVEKRPLVQMADQKESMEAKKNAWNDIRTRLNSLNEKAKALQNSETFDAMKATSTDEEAVTFTASRNSPVGSYNVAVEQLATNSSLIGGTVALSGGDSTTELGLDGAFTINGDTEISVSATDSVRDVAGKINETTEESGVRATVIDSRLVLENVETGDQAITVADQTGSNVVEDLGLASTAQVNQGKNALFSVNGVAIERSSNTVDDVIENTTIQLYKEHESGTSDRVEIKQDTDKVAGAVKAYVDQYNSVMSFIDGKLAAGDPENPGSRGTLAGDGTLMRLQSTLRSNATAAIKNEDTSISSIAELGVTTVDRYGKLQFDRTKFEEVMAEKPEDVEKFFETTNAEGNDIGFAAKAVDYMEGFVSSTGIINSRTQSYERSLKDIDDRIEDFSLRMERKEEYYTNMFARLDAAMMEAESQTAWLTGQINSMNASMGMQQK
ncbi:MAG TPA: hypothetical protein DHN33_03495 [Eubacteriaceae bacterium]|nr:hypothetical protein [Eubacteriaceae bacterium]